MERTQLMRITAVSSPFNSRNTLWRSLSSLARQNVPVSLRMLDNGSTDGTEWWITTDRFKKNLAEIGLHTVRILPPIPAKAILISKNMRRNKHLEHQLAKAAYELRGDPPDAILWLQADVLMPDGALKAMVEAMDAEPRLGGVGIIHRDEVVDHVRMGCTLYRWEPFAELAEIGFFSDGCPCRWMHRNMEKNGWTLRNVDGVIGTHLGAETAEGK